jgi:hypothetical protein
MDKQVIGFGTPMNQNSFDLVFDSKKTKVGAKYRKITADI